MRFIIEGVTELNEVELLGVNGGTCTSSYNPNNTPQTSPTNTSPGSCSPGSCSPGGCTPGTCPGPATVPGKCNALDGPDPSREDWEKEILKGRNNPRREDMTWANNDSDRNEIVQKYKDFYDRSQYFGSSEAFKDSFPLNGRLAVAYTVVDGISGVTCRLIDINDDGVADALSYTEPGRR